MLHADEFQYFISVKHNRFVKKSLGNQCHSTSESIHLD